VYKLFLTLRYLRKRRIAYFAIAAVTLCTAMVLIVMSVMGGFLDQLKFKARGLLGDIIVDNRSYSGFPLYEEFIADITQWTNDDGEPLVLAASPVIYSYGLLRFHGTPQTHLVRVVGLRLDEACEITAFGRGLYYEKFYPGTTSLAPQRQPLLGFDIESDAIIDWHDEQGRPMGPGPRPLLPPKYQAALEQSWAAGVRDDESPSTEWGPLLRAAGLPEIVGVYAPVEGPEPPQLDGEPWPGLIIGRDIIAKRLPDGQYKRYWYQPRGCLLTVTLLPVSSGGGADMPIKQPFRYSDDSRTGIYEIDSQHVYCEFALLQELLSMDAAERVDPETGQVLGTVPGRCSQIQVKIAPGVDPHALAQRLQQHYRTFVDDERFELDFNDRRLVQLVEAMTWEESQAHIIAPVEKERRLVTTLFAGMALVSAVLVLCILYMIVLQKTPDIGIIKSIGGSHVGVALIFILYGAIVGLIGAVLGAILAYDFVTYINDIQDFLTRLNPAWQVWDRSVYSFDQIPNTVRMVDIVVVIIAAVIAATVGSLLAALRAGFMQPVEALRHE
jgi:lipoprotein-releasing system permease protein